MRAPLLFLGLWLLASGCALPEGRRRERVPQDLLDARLVDASAHAKCNPIDPFVIAAMRRTIQRHREDLPADRTIDRPMNILAISGGGMYGAFDVGVLNGWSASESRPTFDLVTGVSAGALIATFAFLGPQYDDFLREAFSNATARDIYQRRSLVAMITSDSIVRSRPLESKIDAAITPEILNEVARAHAAGRRLYVGTTNLDTRRLTVWDMGAIASSGTPEALNLYRKIILASASVPGFMPPAMIEVEVDSKVIKEMHVDGGTTASVFLPTAMMKCDPLNLRLRPGSNVYVICSGKLYADTDTVKRHFAAITIDAITSMLYAGCRNDIFKIFTTTLLCGMDFHLIALPQDFPPNPNSMRLPPEQVRALYDLGYQMGLTKEGWRQTPPGSEVDEQTLPRTGTKYRRVDE
jgi:Patatin-like phospholipase